jgi:hypothetical protein
VIRKATETRAASETTEPIAYVLAVVGVLIVGGGLGARQAWLHVTLLTVGSMIGRGLATSGSREPYTDHR